MRGKDTLIIMISLLGVAASFSCAAWLMPSINRERVVLQLTANEQLMKNLPPEIAVTQAALGSFRGLAVDILWARAEQMKQDGQYWEANQLADMITKLQPRFPQVWADQAWNMAYNISVATHTPQERWKWVSDGIDLLRNQGIPLNPNAVQLYKELSWIFLHKIGQFSDDMHWYYKPQLALRWQKILGEPVAGTTQQVIDQFKPIAELYEQYINQQDLDTKVREELAKLIDDHELGPKLYPLRDLSIELFDIRVSRIHDDLASGAPELAKKLEPLLAVVHAQRNRMIGDPVKRFERDHPAAAKQIRALADMGFNLDQAFLASVAMLQAEHGSLDLKLLGAKVEDMRLTEIKQLDAWLNDKSIAEARDNIIAFTRAKVLHDDFHMDPIWMLELMKGSWFVERGEKPTPVPLDWRHPAVQGLYWATLGVRKSKGLLRPGDYDLLNTDRNMLHALQALMHNGKILYDPMSGSYTQQPDIRYIPAYDRAVFGASDRIFSKRLKESAAPESFKDGHENFLIYAVQQLHFAGRDDMASEYYAKLRRLYSNKQEGRAELYSKPLREFVLYTFIKDGAGSDMDSTRGAVQGMLNQAIDQGLVNGDIAQANARIDDAHYLYTMYQNKQNYKTLGPRNRMSLPPFDEMIADVFIRYLTTPMLSQRIGLIKARAWHNAPVSLRQRVYDRVKPQLYDQLRKSGLNPAIAAPEPPDMDAYRKAHPETVPKKPEPGSEDLKSDYQRK